jgi:hypothetical protein
MCALRIGHDAWGVIASFLSPEHSSVLSVVCKNLVHPEHMLKIRHQYYKTLHAQLMTALSIADSAKQRRSFRTGAFYTAPVRGILDKIEHGWHDEITMIHLIKDFFDLVGRQVCALSDFNVNMAVRCLDTTQPFFFYHQGSDYDKFLSGDPDMSICEWHDLKMQHRAFMKARGYVVHPAPTHAHRMEEFIPPDSYNSLRMGFYLSPLAKAVIERFGVSFTDYFGAMSTFDFTLGLGHSLSTVRSTIAQGTHVRVVWANTLNYPKITWSGMQYPSTPFALHYEGLSLLSLQHFNRKDSKPTRIPKHQLRHNRHTAQAKQQQAVRTHVMRHR